MPDVKGLTTEELKQWIDEGKDFVLLDVLAPASYEARHIPTAKSAPVGDSDFMEKAAALIPDKATPVVAYCSSAQCGASPRAAGVLVDAGYTNVYHYKDGLAGWQNAGYAFAGEAA
ncbi:MAG: rhodanese-like domain-containing protein [Candidatus Andersenbacteria bacterium]